MGIVIRWLDGGDVAYVGLHARCPVNGSAVKCAEIVIVAKSLQYRSANNSVGAGYQDLLLGIVQDKPPAGGASCRGPVCCFF